MVSCYFGFNATKGAEGVGYATTASVVISSVMILTSTYIITALFFGLFFNSKRFSTAFDENGLQPKPQTPSVG